MPITPASARQPAVRLWLLTCLGFVALMVFVGGVTRLTESGLSIVEWNVITGSLPPLSDAAWDEEFAKYQTSPEFQQVNSHFTLADFKQIFWLEWLHRLLGRITGLVFFLPLLYFAARRQIDRPLAWHMSVAVVLVAMQGGVGWVMVASGLENAPMVSPVKLASHLSLALIVFAWTIWGYWQLRGTARHLLPSGSLSLAARVLTLIVGIQILFGAFVAGWDAGMIYNSWPLMDGMFMPPYIYENGGADALSHIPSVQWQHRTFAYLVTFATLCYAALAWSRSSAQNRKYLRMLLSVILVQMLLGIFTIIYEVPIALASAHQLMAVVLWVACVHQCYVFPLRRVDGLQFDQSHGIVARNTSV